MDLYSLLGGSLYFYKKPDETQVALNEQANTHSMEIVVLNWVVFCA
jgi:hypothetical protein